MCYCLAGWCEDCTHHGSCSTTSDCTGGGGGPGPPHNETEPGGVPKVPRMIPARPRPRRGGKSFSGARSRPTTRKLVSQSGNIQTALNFVGDTTWNRVLEMGVDNYLSRLDSLIPKSKKRGSIVIGRNMQPDGSHVNGPSKAVIGPANDSLFDVCGSAMNAYNAYSFYDNSDGEYSNHTAMAVCHQRPDCSWDCQGSQYHESNM